MKAMRMILAALAVATLCVGCRQAGFPASASGAKLSAPRVPVVGVYEPGVPMSYSLIKSFAAATGVKPRIALYYSAWDEKFYTGFAETAWANGAVPLVDIQPGNISLPDIIAGRYDSYLRTYAQAVRSFGHPVILSFGHEMNGTWYSWGAGHVAPATFVAAWRHVVGLFRSAGATNVTWLWKISSLNVADSPLRQWWPGAAWVNEVAIDGYYYDASDTFATVFQTTINTVRKFTRDPILIGETAVGPAAGPGKIASLFAGVRADNLIGLVWFDEAQDKPPHHLDWRLENNAPMLTAFRLAVRVNE